MLQGPGEEQEVETDQERFTWEKFRSHPPTDEWINVMCYSHTMEYYSSHTRTSMDTATRWMDLEKRCSGVNDSHQKTVYCMIPLIQMSRIGKSIDDEKVD